MRCWAGARVKANGFDVISWEILSGRACPVLILVTGLGPLPPGAPSPWSGVAKSSMISFHRDLAKPAENHTS